MVSSALTQAIMNQRAPDLVGSFEQGQNKAIKKRSSALSAKAMQGDAEAMDELRGINPEVAYAVGEKIGAKSAKDINNFIRDARIGSNLLESGNVDEFLQFGSQRVNEINMRGGDPTQTLAVMQQVSTGDVAGALSGLRSFSTSLTDSKNTMTTDEKNFRLWQSMPDGPEKDAFARSTSLSVPKTLEQLQSETDIKTKGAKDVATTKGDIDSNNEAIKAAVKKGGVIFDKIQPISTAISNYDEAIAAIDSGAETGFFASKAPSFRKSSIELDNVVKRLGLDVIGNTTFGALSESELAFALEAAIPTNLEGPALKEWLIRKRNAQMKVKERVQEAASFLSNGTNTISDWVEYDKERQANFSAPPVAGDTQTVEVDF